ncbi:MAG: helix-turn-helix domain-containing protein [Acidobacteria bacterium]|nr:helix-turn-helix domain-containing protein [Acidobacteriota bacterium]
MSKEYLTLKDLADYSSLSISSLTKLIKSGEIPHVRLERKILVKRTDFDYWARRRQRYHNKVNPIVKKLVDQILGVA